MVAIRILDATELGPVDADGGLDPEVVEDLTTALADDGAAIITGAIDEDRRAALIDELDPLIEATPGGRDGFAGYSTRRTGALVARSPRSRDLVADPRILAIANAFLGPFTNRIQLHLTQVISIGPDQGSQPLHRDRLAWGGYIPGAIEPQFNTIWALTDFTADNGATRVALGSPRWEEGRRAGDDDLVQAEMPAGSVLLYSGSVVHGGGENRTPERRVGVNITYCLAWLRTEENQYLSCPPHLARDLDPELQELIGYTMGNYALGYYSDPDGVGEVSDLLPPELAVGRRPRKRAGITDISGLTDD